MRFRDQRFPCDYPVTCYSGPRRFALRLVNVSSRGARLSGDAGCSPGQVLRVELGQGSQPRTAVVRWVRDGTLGLRFDHPLEARTMAVVRKSVGHRIEATRRPEGFNFRELR